MMSASDHRSRQLRSSQFNGKYVLYWMIRDKRAHDNWALLEAQKIAIEQKVPLLVCFQFMGSYKKANIRQYQFLFEGLKETEKELHKYQIGFTLLKGAAEVQIPKIIDQYVVGHLVTDFSPLKVYRNRLKKVLSKVSIPVTQVDAHNIVPVWHASNKKEFAAYTIRPKIKKLLPTFLSEIPKIKKHPFYLKNMPTKTDWSFVNSLEIDFSVKMPDWILPGEKNAIVQLKKLKKSLAGYDDGRNDPTKNHLSNLSPFFHYGHIAPQRVALEITKSSLPLKDKDAFLEEMIVRRELADNFCHYESNYDYFGGFHPWAQKTLNEHRHDEREYLYPEEQFEESETHDPLWNAAQNEMKVKGKMHGFMRMYWAKKILEWSPSPEVAQQTAIELNDKYQLDGRDPNGYTGIAWSIGGIHDRAWFERPIYGKVRYMNYNGCKRKFDVKKYIERNV